MKKYRHLVILLFAALIAYASIYFNHQSLLYNQFDMTVTLKSGNLTALKILQRSPNKSTDFTPNFGRAEVSSNSLYFYVKKMPVRDLEILSTDPRTIVGNVVWSVQGGQATTLNQQFTISHTAGFVPVRMANGAVNYQGNVFFVEIFLLRLIGFYLGLLLIVFLLRRYFSSNYLWLFISVVLTKFYFASKLQILSDGDFPLVLIGAVFAEGAFWLLLNYLFYLQKFLKKVTIMLGVILAIYIINFITNIVHFYYTNQNLRLDNLRFFDSTSLTSVTNTTIVMYCTIAIIPLIVYAVLIVRKQDRRFIARQRTGELILLGAFLLIGGLYYYQPGRIIEDGSSVLDTYATRRNYLELLTPSMMNTVSEIVDCYRSAQPGHALSGADRERLSQLGLGTTSTPNTSYPITKIVLIPIESLSSVLIHSYNPAIPATVTTELDRLLAAYPHVDNFYTTREPTLYGMLADLSSHMDMNEAIKPGFISLPKHLNQKGFQTIFIQGMDKNWANYAYYFDRFGFSRQIAKDEFQAKYPTSNQNFGWGFSDKVILNTVADELHSTKPGQKKFISVLTIDTHMPGGRVDPDLDLSPVADQTNPLLLSLYSTDRTLAAFMHRLQQQNLLKDDTLIILTADHSSPLHGNFIKLAGVGGKRLLDRIPLIFITNNKALREHFRSIESKYASQIDLAPTILSILGYAPPAGMLGHDIAGPGPAFALTYTDQTMEYISSTPSYIVSLKSTYPTLTPESALRGWLSGVMR